MAITIPELRQKVSWYSAQADKWRRALRAQVLENRDRIVTSLQGTWDQVADSVEAGVGAGSPLTAASNFTQGDYYVATKTGVVADLNGEKPEIAGQTLAPNDQILSIDGQWFVLSAAQDFLSSVIDDTAAGVITFNQPAVGLLAAAADNEYIRKGESEAYADSRDAAHVGATDPHGDRAYSDSQLDARVSNWSAKAPTSDWVPATNDQWVGDEDEHPRGVAFGVPSGDPDVSGLQGVVLERTGAADGQGGVALIGFKGVEVGGGANVTDPGTLANVPVEVSGEPVLLMGQVFLETSQLLNEDYYLIVGAGSTLADGRHIAPLLVGPQYNPTLVDEATDNRNIQLDLGILEDVVTLTLTQGPYNPGSSSFRYEIRLSEEGGRTANFDVEIWANIGGSGLSFLFRDEYALTGQAQNINQQFPITAQTLNVGDQIVMRASAIGTHPQSEMWVRGLIRNSRLEVRQN